jgi:cytochrome b561
VSQSRYDFVAMTLHWVIALGILFQIVMGLAMVHLDLSDATKFSFYQLHKSVGISVLLVVLLRILWRFTHKPPPLPAMPELEKVAATGTHWLFYALMILLPLTGWADVTLSPFHIPTVLFGRVPWPDFPGLAAYAGNKAANDAADFIHSKLGYVILGLVVLHVAAALRHHFWLRDDVLRRMLPFARRT